MDESQIKEPLVPLEIENAAEDKVKVNQKYLLLVTLSASLSSM